MFVNNVQMFANIVFEGFVSVAHEGFVNTVRGMAISDRGTLPTEFVSHRALVRERVPEHVGEHGRDRCP